MRRFCTGCRWWVHIKARIALTTAFGIVLSTRPEATIREGFCAMEGRTKDESKEAY